MQTNETVQLDKNLVEYAKAWIENLLEIINKLVFGENSRNVLIHQLEGTSKVAKLTGKKFQGIKERNGIIKLERRNAETGEPMNKINLIERDNSQKGESSLQ